MDFILENVSLDKAILFFISVSHLASGVMIKPKYLQVSTCFILSPLQRMLHTGTSDCFEMTMKSKLSEQKSKELIKEAQKQLERNL